MGEFLRGYHEVIPDIAPPNLAHDLGFLMGVVVAAGLFVVVVVVTKGIFEKGLRLILKVIK